MANKYRTAFITVNTGHDFSALLQIADKIVFLTSGYEQEDELRTTINTALKGYDPMLDILVPVGNVVANLLLGSLLGTSDFHIAIFHDKVYHSMKVYNG